MNIRARVRAENFKLREVFSDSQVVFCANSSTVILFIERTAPATAEDVGFTSLKNYLMEGQFMKKGNKVPKDVIGLGTFAFGWTVGIVIKSIWRIVFIGTYRLIRKDNFNRNLRVALAKAEKGASFDARAMGREEIRFLAAKMVYAARYLNGSERVRARVKSVIEEAGNAAIATNDLSASEAGRWTEELIKLAELNRRAGGDSNQPGGSSKRQLFAPKANADVEPRMQQANSDEQLLFMIDHKSDLPVDSSLKVAPITVAAARNFTLPNTTLNFPQRGRASRSGKLTIPIQSPKTLESCVQTQHANQWALEEMEVNQTTAT